MQLDADLTSSGDTLAVSAPPTRSDILHACDVVEDVAIAYGYNNIPKKVHIAHPPQASSMGSRYQ
jgi:phenylalanyl-tRNA synthetase beta chain